MTHPCYPSSMRSLRHALAHGYHDAVGHLRRMLDGIASLSPHLRRAAGQGSRLLRECATFLWSSLRWTLGSFWGAVLGLAVLLYFSGGTLLRGLLSLLGLASAP